MSFSRKIKNIGLLARCVVRALSCGRANKPPKNITRIIVMPDGKLGDVVCGTPVLAAIRNNFPEARIIVGGNSLLHKALLADSALVDEYVEFRDDACTIERIRACHADAALLTGPSFIAAALLYLSGIPLVVTPRIVGGTSPHETWSYKVLKFFVVTFPYQKGEYAPRERLRALEPLGIVCGDTTKHLGFSKTAEANMLRFLADNAVDMKNDFIVGLSPSAGHKIKEWPEERFAEVADYLIEKYHTKVVLIGGPSDVQKIQNVLANTKNAKAIINTQGAFNIDELKALVSHLDLFISVDTGPIYIAEAFGVPTIDITGPIDENEQPPRGRLHRNVVPPQRVRPELFVLDARSYNAEEALRQIRSITAFQVEQEIDLLIRDMKIRDNETSS